jgi:hypothetical protein
VRSLGLGMWKFNALLTYCQWRRHQHWHGVDDVNVDMVSMSIWRRRRHGVNDVDMASMTSIWRQWRRHGFDDVDMASMTSTGHQWRLRLHGVDDVYINMTCCWMTSTLCRWLLRRLHRHDVDNVNINVLSNHVNIDAVSMTSLACLCHQSNVDIIHAMSTWTSSTPIAMLTSTPCWRQPHQRHVDVINFLSALTSC